MITVSDMVQAYNAGKMLYAYMYVEESTGHHTSTHVHPVRYSIIPALPVPSLAAVRRYHDGLK